MATALSLRGACLVERRCARLCPPPFRRLKAAILLAESTSAPIIELGRAPSGIRLPELSVRRFGCALDPDAEIAASGASFSLDATHGWRINGQGRAFAGHMTSRGLTVAPAV
jgi:hypothetical protein